MKLTAAIDIRSDLATVWRLTQTPDQHVRWDLRFTDIRYLPKESRDEPQRFGYRTRIGFGAAIDGWGQTLAERNGTGSSLRFGSDDPKSLIRDGAGGWAYRAHKMGVHFTTVYDYRVRYGHFGRCLDTLLFRPLMTWATRWSFDRLRLWIERGLPPEISFRLWILKIAARCALGFIWLIEGVVPKLLRVSSAEIELVRRSGLYWPTPQAFLRTLGAAEILGGLWLLSGRAERCAATANALAATLLAMLVAVTEPAVLADRFGGLTKNAGLLACSCAIWLLSSITPRASRASGRLTKRSRL